MTITQQKRIHKFNQRRLSDRNINKILIWGLVILSAFLLYTSFMAGYNEQYLKKQLNNNKENNKKRENNNDKLPVKNKSAFT